MIHKRMYFGISMSPRRNRRTLVVVYWCVMAVFLYAFLGGWPEASHSRKALEFVVLFAIQAVMLLPQLLGGVRAGGVVKPFRKASLQAGDVQTLLHPTTRFGEDAPLDERETGERDRMHFLAYTLTRWFALLLLAIYALIAANFPAALRQTGTIFLCLLTLSLWSLPQTLILWTEPDMEEAQ
jgi:hypothetical protein